MLIDLKLPHAAFVKIYKYSGSHMKNPDSLMTLDHSFKLATNMILLDEIAKFYDPTSWRQYRDIISLLKQHNLVLSTDQMLEIHTHAAHDSLFINDIPFAEYMQQLSAIEAKLKN